jgi:hypothetical protein
MPRTCTVCAHPDREAIDRALVACEPFRNIAERFGTSATALFRHKAEHLPAALAKAQEAAEVASADDLVAQLRGLHAKTLGILAKAEKVGELRTALAAIREARGNLELLAELLHELDRRPQINLLLSPEWQRVRAVLVEALLAFPDARSAVAARLVALESNQAGGN